MLSPWKPSRDLSRYFSMVNETLTKLFTPIERTSNSSYLLSLYLFLGFLGFKNGCGLMLVQCDSHKHQHSLTEWMNQTARLIQLPSVEILTVSLATCVKVFDLIRVCSCPAAECVTALMFFTTFWRHLWSKFERTEGNMGSIRFMWQKVIVLLVVTSSRRLFSNKS